MNASTIRQTGSVFIACLGASIGAYQVGQLWGLVVVGVGVLLWVALIRFFEAREHARQSQLDLGEIHRTSFKYASRSDIRQIVELDKNFFDSSDLLPVETFAAWSEKNNRTFRCLMYRGDVIGYFSILPLKPDTLSRFMAGEIKEDDYTPEDIRAKDNASNPSKSVHFFSIALLKKHRALTILMLYEIGRELNAYRRSEGVTNVVVTAATRRGERLISDLGFTKIAEGVDRADGNNLYEVDCSKVEDFVDYICGRLSLGSASTK
ncbi:MAG: hypothetical protein AAGJ86_10085 [Pseudomonadota bacterium]